MATTLVIFGVTGDLSTRKLIPALEHILDSDEFEDLNVIGVSRRELDIDGLVATTLGHDRFNDRFSGFTLDFSSVDDYRRLRDSLSLSGEDQVLIYLSVPPGAAAEIVDLLGEAGFNSPQVKLLFEKPFGFDLESAQDFISRTTRYFDEGQIYRIDHYLAKEVSQEIIRLRSNAENRHRSWGCDSIESITIVASEKIGIEDRANFYEQTGALRDFVQGHLLQLLALVLLKVPDDYQEANLPQYRQAALEQLETVDAQTTIRAQYEGYEQTVGNIGSRTETFVNMALSSNDPQWRNVAIRLVSGKSLQDKRTFIEIVYKDGTKDVFEEGTVRSSDARLPDAYERVLAEAIKGNKSIFASSDEILRAWEILASVQRAWDFEMVPLGTYIPGTHWADIT